MMHTNYKHDLPTIMLGAPGIVEAWPAIRASISSRVEKVGELGIAFVGLAKSAFQTGGYYITNGYLCKENGFAQWKVSQNLWVEAWKEAYPVVAAGALSLLTLMILAGKVHKRLNRPEQPASEKREQTPNQTLDLVKRSVTHIVKKTAETVIFTLFVQAVIFPLTMLYMAYLPPFNSQLSERSARWIKDGCEIFGILAVSARSAASLLVPKVDMQFHHGFRGSLDCRKMFISAAIEECIFRGCIQTGALKTLPTYLLEQFGYTRPEAEALVDHRLAKCGRIFATSALYMAVHATMLGDSRGMLMSQFTSGLIASTSREAGCSIAQLSLAHFLFNFFPQAIIGAEATRELIEKVQKERQQIEQLMVELEKLIKK